LLQPSRIDPLQHSHDDFQPFPRGFYTYCFEHLELFYEYIQPTLCSDFSENSYKAMIPKGQQEFNSEGIHPSFSPSCCIIEDTTRNYLFDANLSMGNFFFQPMVCCKHFHNPATYKRTTNHDLGEKIFLKS
jgi:hypothetical protein